MSGLLLSHTLSWVKEPFGSFGIADARNDSDFFVKPAE